MVNRQRLLDRFLTYVRVGTTACEKTESYPSSAGQLELGRILADELRSMGVGDVEHDQHGLVWGTIPGNLQRQVPVVAFNAHLDTSPETSGDGVSPQVIERFDGRDRALPGDSSQVIAAATCTELPAAAGQTIITSDGTTLLGADDKAGVAIIMELAQCLLENPDLPHGPIRVLFTCDEEIGRGTQHVDLQKLAADVCYTFDGGGRDQIDHETFSADLALVTIRGVNIHPSIAKGRMVNAIRAAADLVQRLPRELSPEQTSDRQGFLHPYTMTGGVGQVEIQILLRDFEAAKLIPQAELIRRVAVEVEAVWPGVRIDVSVRKQYRNMAEGLMREPRALQYAIEAHRRLGREPQLTIVRGGTDGSQFTEMGLPTPNLSSGQHNIHSPLEWASLDEMVAACEVGVEIVRRWGEDVDSN
ncbi:MAG TPA: peptidase T [Pirellulaceae bacterium]|nr:peptidase T [Pirellulaceae bacterium]